ncbi:MAG: hypothetical protein RMJ36_06595 [Candidatus Calescibacterium sp.]|nr:hypothetical protein [Candidatus Calescibacterium sp.]MDW8133304.1 hypothetical protein [Candidatus Calescibacterium sp.]
MEDYIEHMEEKKIVKYSKRKIVMAGLLGAVIGIVAYVIYENLDQETRENFTKQLTKTVKNLIQNILPNE